MVDTVKDLFKEILPDTRAYDGCQGVEVVENQDESGNVILIETWDSREKYDKYLGWRVETGLLDRLGPMLDGAPSVSYFDKVDA
jgi:quinol monooxygenase YgiN